MQPFLEWVVNLEWPRLLPELIGKALGFLTGFGASWFLLFRRRLNALQRIQAGDSDDLIFQMHRLSPMPRAELKVGHLEAGEKDASQESFLLLFRNVSPKTTLNQLYDNIAVREVVTQLADNTTLNNPILKTEGTIGFELLNDALGHIAGLLAISSFPREQWLFVMTCEDRKVVRKKCIRCFLIRPDDLKKFASWDWCTKHIFVEKPWHWYRVVALYRIACEWQEEQRLQALEQSSARDTQMPLVDKQFRHDRIRSLSIGICPDEIPIGPPCKIAWEQHLPELAKLGMKFPVSA